MIRPRINIIAAMTRSRAIGQSDGSLIHRIPDDLKRFKALTTGHPIIMGRKTYESIGRPLPGRTNIIVTRNPDFRPEGVTICPSLDVAIDESAKAAGGDEIFIIGGGQIYAQTLPLANRLYLTLIESDNNGEVHFPDYSEFTSVLMREDRIDEKTGLRYVWLNLEK